MEATELRIGNLCREITHSRNEIVKTSVRHFENIALNQIDLFPIPLTEELAIELGCGCTGDYLYYDRFKLLWKESYNYWYVVDYHSLTYLTKIEYVHEFQNFVYAMNKEELSLTASTPQR